MEGQRGPQKNVPGRRQFHKGDVIYEQGAPIKALYLIQSGLVSLTIEDHSRVDKSELVSEEAETDESKDTEVSALQKFSSRQIEIIRLVQPQILGLEFLQKSETYSHTAIAINETNLQEISLQEVQEILVSAKGSLRELLVGLLTKEGRRLGEIQKAKFAARVTSCPLEQLPKLLSILHIVGTYIGETKAQKVVVPWPALKRYCQRIFGESPVRLEQLLYVFVAMGFCELQMVKDENDPEAIEELGFIHFTQLDQVGVFGNVLRSELAAHPRKAMDKLSQGDGVLARFAKEILFWNAHGRPRGMPEVEVVSKYAPALKKAG